MKTPTAKDLMAKIEALEKRVRELEARPPNVINITNPPAPAPLIQPIVNPVYPDTRPWWEYPGSTCGGVSAIAQAGTLMLAISP